MTGIIEGYKPYLNNKFFIRGDDGREYYTITAQVAEKKARKHFLWDGNRVSFEIAPPKAEGLRPFAVNVIPDPVYSPDRELKALHRQQEKILHEQAKARKAEKARINAIIQANMARLREFRERTLRYVVQWMPEDEWEDFYTGEGLACFQDQETAQKYLLMMQWACAEKKFRVRAKYVVEGAKEG